MVGPRDYSVHVEGFVWDFEPGRNVDHIARHRVRPEDVEEVYSLAPHYFRNTQSSGATHLMVGANRQGRYLRVAITESYSAGRWEVATAHWLSRSRGEKMYLSK